MAFLATIPDPPPGPQGVVCNSATTALDEISQYIAHIATSLRRDGKQLCEPNQQAEEEYCRAVFDASLGSRKFYAACTPGYYSNEGAVDVETKSLSSTYPGGVPGNGGIPRFIRNHRELQEPSARFSGLDVQ